MKREIVNSKDILSIGYGVFSTKLEIEFTNGDIYQYLKVPIEKYKLLLDSSCYSTFFHEKIRKFYDFKKIS